MISIAIVAAFICMLLAQGYLCYRSQSRRLQRCVALAPQLLEAGVRQIGTLAS